MGMGMGMPGSVSAPREGEVGWEDGAGLRELDGGGWGELIVGLVREGGDEEEEEEEGHSGCLIWISIRGCVKADILVGKC